MQDEKREGRPRVWGAFLDDVPPPLQAGFNVGGCELAEEPLFSRQLGYFLVPKSLLHEHTGTPFHVLWYARGIRSVGGNLFGIM
jgi:hypothetical protein